MPPHLNSLSSRPQDRVLQLQGEVHALQGMLAALIAHVALLSRAPVTRRDKILHSMTSMLPGALAKIELDGSPEQAVGFERAVEAVTNLARNAIRIEPIVSQQQSNGSC